MRSLNENYVNPATTQKGLVSNLKANGVLHTPSLVEAFERVDRALFLPTTHPTEYREPYVNEPQSIRGTSENVSTPFHHALMLESLASALSESPGKILDAGVGTGYVAAVLATAFPDAQLRAVDRLPACVRAAETALESYSNVEVALVDNVLDFVSSHKHDVQAIHVGFAVPREILEAIVSTPTTKRCGLSCVVCEADGSQQLETWACDGESWSKMDSKSFFGASKHHAGPFVAQTTRAEELADVEARLKSWREAFASEHGRNASLVDVTDDADASKLFERFRTLRQRTWDK